MTDADKFREREPKPEEHEAKTGSELIGHIIDGVEQIETARRLEEETTRQCAQKSADIRQAEIEAQPEIVATMLAEANAVIDLLREKDALKPDTIWPLIAYETYYRHHGPLITHYVPPPENTSCGEPGEPVSSNSGHGYYYQERSQRNYYGYSGLAIDSNDGIVWYETFTGGNSRLKGGQLQEIMQHSTYKDKAIKATELNPTTRRYNSGTKLILPTTEEVILKELIKSTIQIDETLKKNFNEQLKYFAQIIILDLTKDYRPFREGLRSHDSPFTDLFRELTYAEGSAIMRHSRIDPHNFSSNPNIVRDGFIGTYGNRNHGGNEVQDNNSQSNVSLKFRDIFREFIFGPRTDKS